MLTRDEVTRFLWAVDDPQIQILFMTMYATGMRRQEAQLLRVQQDVDSGRGVIRVLGKGQKQRLVPLSTTLLETLRAYWVAYCPDELLFPSHRLDPPSPRSASPALDAPPSRPRASSTPSPPTSSATASRPTPSSPASTSDASR